MAKLLQYQILAEPLSTEAPPAETVTVDKWYKNTETPQSNWAKAARFSLAAITAGAFFLNLSTVEATTPDKWHPKQNEPVRTVEHREYQFPTFFIDPTLLTQAERIDLDKWFVRLSEPQRDVKRQQFAYPSLFWYPRILISLTLASGPQYHITYTDLFQYQQYARPLEPSLVIEPESITLDKWFKELSTPRWDIRRWQFLYPPFSVDPFLLTQAERIDSDKWTGRYPDIIWGPKHFEFMYPSLFIDPQLLTQAERIDLDKWFVRLSEPRWDIRRWQWLYPTRDDRTETMIVTEFPIDALFAQIDYIFREKFRPYYYPYLAIDPAFMLEHERIDLDKWYVELQRPPKGPKHWEYLYPPFTIDPQLLTTTERIDLDKWFRELDRPPFRYKPTPHLYPYFWWNPRILIKPMIISGQNTYIIFTATFQYQKFAFNPYPYENAFSLPSKRTTVDYTERTKNTVDFTEATKTTVDFTERAKSTTDFTATSKNITDFTERTKTTDDWTDP